MKLLRRSLMVLLVAFIAGVFYWHAVFDDRVLARDVTAAGQRVTLLSRTHTLGRIYMSMQGPFSNQPDIRLTDDDQPRELIWITGVRAELVGRDGSSPISREFFCHSNLTFNLDKLSPARTRSDSEFTPTQDWRLFTLIPGRLELSLPEGFGLPVYSDEPLDYLSMSLNMNEKTGSRKVRFLTSVDFVRDASVPKGKPITPLFRRAIYGFEPIDRASPHTMCTGGNHPGAACGPFVGKAASNSFVASLGTTNTIHWMIPP
ncbi:MAG: hypothetical protein H7Z14_21530, partial [Anaerolineae bacterium]|nr:hypothetical protein [Phycisphaerae bacterium]